MFQNVNRVPFSSRSRLFQFQQNENKKMTQWWISFFLFGVHTQNLSLFKDRCVVRLRKDKTPNLMYHIRSETLFISMFWWWTLAINWMTYDQYIYIFYDASVNNPPLCLHVYRCVSIFVWSLPRNVYLFIFFYHLLALRSCVSSVDFIKKRFDIIYYLRWHEMMFRW